MALTITGQVTVTGTLNSNVAFVANSVTFDGTNDFLLLSSAIGGADSSATLASIWLKVDDAGGDGNLMIITDTTNEHFRVSRNASDQIEINLENDASTVLWNFTSTNTFNSTTNTGWHHLLFSTDLGGSPTATVYLDDAVLAGTDNTSPTTGSIDFTPAAWSFGADVSGNNKLTGSLSEVYIHTVSLDLAVEANRRKFINSGGKAVFLGADGSIPTGTVPLIFLTGATAIWEVNKGSGDGFTLTGTLETGTTPDVPVGGGEEEVSFTSGSMFSWGNEGTLGNMGQGTTSTPLSSPSIIGAATTWDVISAGRRHTMAIRTNGDLFGWGSDLEGQLGDDGSIGNSYNSPILAVTTGAWADVSAGGYHTLAIKTDGTLWAWGEDVHGQVGFGSGGGTDERSPISIAGGTWISISAGYFHSAAVKNDGSLYCWGLGSHGAIGNGSTSNQNAPVLVSTGWASVSCGYQRTTAIKTNGKMYSWGYDSFGSVGALGLGVSGSISTPSQIGSDSDWESVFSGQYSNSLAIKTEGSLWGWGYNSFAGAGALGLGNANYYDAPTQIGNDTNWKEAAISREHSIAIRTDGTLWSWGYRNNGMLGDGVDDATRQYTPQQIGADENWAHVSVNDIGSGGGSGRSLAVRDTTG